MSLMIGCMLNSKQCEFGAFFVKAMFSWNHVWKFCFNKRWFCLLYCYWYDTYQQLYVAEKARKYITQLLMWKILEFPCEKSFDNSWTLPGFPHHDITNSGSKKNQMDSPEKLPSYSWIHWISSRNFSITTFSFELCVNLPFSTMHLHQNLGT